MCSRTPSTEDLVRRQLESVLGPITAHPAADGESDIVVQFGGKAVFIETKNLPVMRLQDLEGQLAVGVLQLRRCQTPEVVPLVVVVTRRFGERAAHAAASFMDRLAPDVGWGLMDHSGRLRLEIPRLKVSLNRRGSAPHRRPRGTNIHLFTDLNRWLLKILLLGQDEQAKWGGPRLIRPVATATALHRVAGVSLEKAHRFVRTFEQAGHLQQGRDGLNITEPRELLDQWFADQALRYAPALPMGSIFGEAPEPASLVQQASGRAQEMVFGGFRAAHLLNLGHAVRDDLMLHTRADDTQKILEVLDLQPCEPRDAQLWLANPRFTESVFRGRLQVGPVQVVDELQLALDVVTDPGRGSEQAEFIKERLLARWEDS